MREVKSKYAILGMLSIEPMSGYDIKKEVEKSISNFWTESYGQIYPVLRNLIAQEASHKNRRERSRQARSPRLFFDGDGPQRVATLAAPRVRAEDTARRVSPEVVLR